MAPRAPVSLSFTVDSASDDEMADDLNVFPTPDSNTENKPPAPKPRGRAAAKAKPAPTAKANTKAKTATRRVSGESVLGVKKQNAAVAKKAGGKVGRKALAEVPQVHNPSDTEEVDEFGNEDEIAEAIEETKPAKRGRPAKVKKAQEEEAVAQVPPTKKTRKAANEETATKPAPKTKTAAKSKAAKRVVEPEPEETTIPETQAEADEMDIEESIEADEIPESMPPPPIPRPSARRNQPQPRTARQTSASRRAGSVSDSERDPALRRRVGEITKKLEAMTTKYETLKEAATSSKDSNFDQLKRRTDQVAKGMHTSDIVE